MLKAMCKLLISINNATVSEKRLTYTKNAISMISGYVFFNLQNKNKSIQNSSGYIF